MNACSSTGDNDIFDWVSGKAAVPAEADTPVAAQAAGVPREVLGGQTLADRLASLHRKAGRWTLAGLPEGADALVLAEIARTTGGQDILHVARDGQRLERLQDGLRFFAPEREVLVFPAWDCLPYDRLSPHPDIVAERLETLVAARRAEEARRAGRASSSPRPARCCSSVPPRSLYAEAATVLRKGQTSMSPG